MRFFSSDPSVAQVPVSITIPAGQTTGTFTITSNAAAPPTIVQIMGATPDNISRTYNLSVNPATPAGPSLSSVSFVPTSIVGGQNATGTVRFTGPMSAGRRRAAVEQQPAIARVPQETVVSANTSTSTFNLATSTVSPRDRHDHGQLVRRHADDDDHRQAGGAAGEGRRADHQGHLEEGAAHDRGHRAPTPTRSSASTRPPGSFLFDLTNKGGGRYADQRGFITNPVQISVRSNFGGSDSARMQS